MTRVVRVGVAVDPPLLADLLISLLAGPKRRTGRPGPRMACDLAIVSPAHAGSVSASRVIRLPDDHGDAGIGKVTTVSGSYPVAIRDVEAVERLIEAYLPA